MGSFGGVAAAFGGAPNIGAGLRAAREYRGLTLEDLANATRVRRSYLAALEEMKLDQLPSRPFTTGYVRAVAQVVGLNPDEAVARFRKDAPDGSEPLRAPLGVSRERDPRVSLLGGAAAIVIGAVIVWNVAQHAVVKKPPPPTSVPQIAAGPAAAPKQGAIVLSAPLPAPVESQAPAPYVTPGLVQGQTVDGASPPAGPAPAAAPAQPAEALPPSPINPRAAIYGAEPAQSAITVRARKPASLIIRGADGSVYFARQLQAGEAYRAPMLAGLTVDVSDPAAFDVYAQGAFKGQLAAPQTPIARLSS